MARLALVAVLLLALVPTLGRLAQARAAGIDAAPSWSALCTARGLQSVPLAGDAHGKGESPGSPRGAGDCDYCPLLSTAMPVAVAPLSVPPAPAPAAALCTSHAPPAREDPHPCGLGSRGPPTAS